MNALVPAAIILLAGCAPAPQPLVLSDDERASHATLLEGDPAPPLEIQEWVRGQPVLTFNPGTIYVVDFWATWCSPCLAIMPRLSRLQARHQDRLRVIAVSTIDEHNRPHDIRRFVRDHPDLTAVTIAIDRGDASARSFRVASRETAIPHSFVIDPRGRLAWHGHPADLEPVVDAILDGSWDLDSARRERLRREADRAKAIDAVNEYLAASRAKNLQGMLDAAELATTIPVGNMSAMSPNHWAWNSRTDALVALGRHDEARRVARQAADTPGVRENHAALARLAVVIRPASLADASRYADLALERLNHDEGSAPSDEWTRYLHEANALDRDHSRVLVAEVRAAEQRWAEAAALLRHALIRWPDDPRLVPSTTFLRRRLAEYESLNAQHP